MGKTDLEAIYAQRYQGNGPVTHFMRAYLDVRALPSLDGDAFDRAWQRASIEVQATEQALPQKCEVQALHGALLHLKYLRSDDRALAEEANTHYLLALDLAHDNQRYRAMILEQLALLHGAVGNDRIAVGHFEARAALPFADGPLQLGHQLGLARSLFHVGREADAAKAASVAVALTNQPALARFRPLALDRAALYALAAGDGTQAAKLYDDAVGTAPAGSARNDIVRALARAAAALQAGRPEETLEESRSRRRADGAAGGAARARLARLQSRRGARHLSIVAARAARAGAARAGRLDDAQRTLTERLQLLIERTKKRSYDDDLLALSTAEAQLADIARAQRQGGGGAVGVGRGGARQSAGREHGDAAQRRAAVGAALRGRAACGRGRAGGRIPSTCGRGRGKSTIGWRPTPMPRCGTSALCSVLSHAVRSRRRGGGGQVARATRGHSRSECSTIAGRDSRVLVCSDPRRRRAHRRRAGQRARTSPRPLPRRQTRLMHRRRKFHRGRAIRGASCCASSRRRRRRTRPIATPTSS